MRGIAGAIILIFTLSCGVLGHPRVLIANQSTLELRNVVVSARKSSVRFSRIAPGQTIQTTLKPRGESGVGITFDAGGRRIAVPEQGYFEDLTGYVVTITIRPDLTVSVETSIED